MNSDLASSRDRNEREQPLSSGRGLVNDGGCEALRGRWITHSTGRADIADKLLQRFTEARPGRAALQTRRKRPRHPTRTALLHACTSCRSVRGPNTKLMEPRRQVRFL